MTDAIAQLGVLSKALSTGQQQPGHKYKRREPTGNPEHPWLYIYEEGKGRPRAAPEEHGQKQRAASDKRQGLGIARKDMPQIPEAKQQEFLEELRKKGTQVKTQQLAANDLQPTQKELNPDNVRQMQQGAKEGKFDPGKKPIIASKDGYILDGHHRWAAVLADDPNRKLNVHVVNLPMRALLSQARDFSGSERRDVKDIGPHRPSVPLSETIERITRPSRGEPAGPPRRHWVNSVTEEGLPADTQKAFKKGDKYALERAALHERVYAKFLDHVPTVPEDKKPVAIVMMGGPASGKGTVLRHLMSDEQDFVNVNPDDCKEQLPEYERALHLREKDGLPVSAKDAALSVHEESSDMAEEVRKRAVAQRKNLVLDGTGKNAEKYRKKIQELRDAGYHVRLLMPHIDIDEARKRAKARADHTGRYVPDDFVEEAHHVIPGNFEAIASAADEAVLLDNSKPPPRPVWTLGGEGGEQVLDESFVGEFRKMAKERHGRAREKGWMKALRAMSLRKGDKEKGKPPSLPLEGMLKRFRRDQGEAPDNATGIEDAADVARWRREIKSGEDDREEDMNEPARDKGKASSSKGAPNKPKPNKAKANGEQEEETPRYATRRGEEYEYEEDDARDPEARFVVSKDTPEGAHYERPQDSENFAHFGQWRSARKKGLQGKQIPRHLVEGALKHAERHHFDSKSHHEAYDDYQEHQGEEGQPVVPPSHRAAKGGGGAAPSKGGEGKDKKKPKDAIDMVGKIAAGELDLDPYAQLMGRLPPDAGSEDVDKLSISHTGEEYAAVGESARALERDYFSLYGLRRGTDPIDALAPLMKSGERAGHKYTRRERHGDHYVYFYKDQEVHREKSFESEHVAQAVYDDIAKRARRRQAHFEKLADPDNALQWKKIAEAHEARAGSKKDESPKSGPKAAGKTQSAIMDALKAAEGTEGAEKGVYVGALPGRLRTTHYAKIMSSIDALQKKGLIQYVGSPAQGYITLKKSDAAFYGKGLYCFDLSSRKDALAVPDKLLYDYVCAFVEEALEKECREPQHKGAVSAAAMAHPVLHELVQYIPKNPNLKRAAEKFEISAATIAQVIEDRGMLRSRQQTDAFGATTDLQSMAAMGAVGDRGATGEVMLASKRGSWVQQDPFATRSLQLRKAPQPLVLEDGPLPTPIRKSMRFDEGPMKIVSRACLLHGDPFRDQVAHQPYVQCSCG